MSIIADIFTDLVGRNIEITQELSDIYTGGYDRENEGWYKLGPSTLQVGECFQVEYIMSATAVRLVQLPEKVITADVTTQDIFNVDTLQFFKVL